MQLNLILPATLLLTVCAAQAQSHRVDDRPVKTQRVETTARVERHQAATRRYTSTVYLRSTLPRYTNPFYVSSVNYMGGGFQATVATPIIPAPAVANNLTHTLTVAAAPTAPFLVDSATSAAQLPIVVTTYDGGLEARQQQDQLRKERLASIDKDFGSINENLKK